jgi:hypothetical protein
LQTLCKKKPVEHAALFVIFEWEKIDSQGADMRTKSKEVDYKGQSLFRYKKRPKPPFVLNLIVDFSPPSLRTSSL